MQRLYKLHQRKIIITLILLCAGHRFWLAIKNKVPVGWDGGMYKDYLLSHQSFLPEIEITQVPEYLLQGFPPFLGIIGSVLSLFGISADLMVRVGPTVLVFMIGLATYSLLRTWGDHRAVVGGLAVTFSSVMFWLAWSGFTKQLVATLFLVVLCKFLIRRRYLLGCILLIALLFTHRPTGMFSVLMLLIFAIIQVRHKTALATWLMIVWAGAITFVMYLPIIGKMIPLFLKSNVGAMFFKEVGGTFFMRQDFLILQTPLILITLAGLYYWIQEKRGQKKGSPIVHKKVWDDRKIRGAKLVWVGWALAISWFALGFTFHNRMQPFLELTTILLVSITVIPACIRHKTGQMLVAFFLVAHIGIGSFIAHSNHLPRISWEEIQRIQTFTKDLPENAYILSADTSYSTWIMGYTDHSRRVIGPYIIDHWNDWTIRKWQQWWGLDGFQKCEIMMTKYYSGYNPLYVFVGARTPYKHNFDGAYCFKLIQSESNTKLYEITYE